MKVLVTIFLIFFKTFLFAQTNPNLNEEKISTCFSQDNFNTIFNFLDSEIKKSKEKFYFFENYEIYIDEKSKVISLKKSGYSHIRFSLNSGVYSINKSKQGNERMVKNGNTIFCKLLDFIKN